ncbi:two-component system, chemotaxis family, response regulator CheY [Pseudoalteromonas ulvae UL12]|uniref:Two-component system response regulator n=1 Tax=Pseudoalteromonas ulvae TaxID=107327 RepID=A0A244CV00_PSEDV|nr:response regulator [Pseudoalteromonas ulvae]MBE0362649.1 two-component system, chemotaxis family, response regulator CheY [Pseudoalteromonas ulvae UL12]OUL59401.1 two-component system response regulator [Pseudoalteromonas ulvae]
MGADFSVLIVDDVGTVRNFLHQTLVHLGIDNISEASTAGQCLQMSEDNQYSIIFLDIELPDGNGKEIIEKLNQISPSSNVVMVSAHSTVENVKDAIDKGAKGFVVKPFSPKKIAAILKKFAPDGPQVKLPD